MVLKVVGASAKRRDLIREIDYEEVSKTLGCAQLETVMGLNQDQCLKRPGNTCSHYKTLKSLVEFFPTIIKVLDIVSKDDRYWKNRDHASNL
jgi:predicted transcriptional regulator